MTTLIVRNNPAQDAGHWYRRDGAPQYTVPAKDGSARPTTLKITAFVFYYKTHVFSPSIWTISGQLTVEGL